jgi:signal transduction histidine kinase
MAADVATGLVLAENPVHFVVPDGSDGSGASPKNLSAEHSVAPKELWAVLCFVVGVLAGGFAVYAVVKPVRRGPLEGWRSHSNANERERIGEDLHDHLGAELARIGAICERAVRLASGHPEVRKSLEQIHRAARVSSQALGELIWLTKSSNDNLPQLAGYLGDMACEMVECTGIVCRLEIPNELPEVEVPYEVRRDVLLAVREMIGNAMVHSGTKFLELGIRWQSAQRLLEVQVVDQGCGMRQSIDRTLGRRPSGGNGIQHLRNRVKKHRGALSFIQGDPGLTVILKIPIGGLGVDQPVVQK